MKKHKHTPRHTKAVMFGVTILVAFTAVFLADTFTGITGAATAEDINEELLLTYRNTFNEKADGMPDIVFTFLGEGVVNIYLSDADVQLYALFKNSELVELEHGTQENPTIAITTTYDTIAKIQQKEITLDDAIDNSLVSFSSSSFVKEAELALVLYSIDVYEFFS